MDLQAFKDALSQAVLERGGLVLSGWVELAEERDSDEPLTVRVEEEEPAVWAELAQHAKPPVVWVSEQELDAGELWMYGGAVPDDVAAKLAALPAQEKKRVDSIRRRLKKLAGAVEVASLEVAVLVSGVLYRGIYDGDELGEIVALVDELAELLG